jgi:hypothetical protein
MKRWVSGVELVIQSMEYEYRGYIYPFAAHSRARSSAAPQLTWAPMLPSSLNPNRACGAWSLR